MSRRLAASVAVVLAFGSTAAVAVALWPDRDVSGSDGVAAVASADPAVGDPPGAAEGDEPAAASQESGGLDATRAAGGDTAPDTGADPDGVAASQFELGPLPAEPPVRPRLKRPPAAGVLFDIDSGEILWQRHATIARPIASLTKLMTALLIAEHGGRGERVAVSSKAASTPGSATGLLPRRKRVPLEPLLQALIMISANDAAVALAEHHSGGTAEFIAAMNRRAEGMGLTCTRFSTPNGLKDRGNHSCALDLAALARATLADERIARIARTRYAKPPFPIKGGRLHLANNHYFLQRGLRAVPGAEVTGLKTGLTDGAGRCYVTTARLGSTHLGVVLLDSPDPLRQVPQLLRAGFAEAGALPAGGAKLPGPKTPDKVPAP
jgi:D-alanyl-D-alanine carboxypeptidase (penicillin-binding protein 5/6)